MVLLPSLNLISLALLNTAGKCHPSLVDDPCCQAVVRSVIFAAGRVFFCAWSVPMVELLINLHVSFVHRVNFVGLSLLA